MSTLSFYFFLAKKERVKIKNNTKVDEGGELRSYSKLLKAHRLTVKVKRWR